MEHTKHIDDVTLSSTDTDTDTDTDTASEPADVVPQRAAPQRVPVGVVLVVVVAVTVCLIAALVIRHRSSSASAVGPLAVVYLESSPAQKAVVDYVADHVAPDYGVGVRAVGMSDSTDINRAVSEGRDAATVMQHRYWLEQVVSANPGLREEAVTGPLFRWVFGIWSDRYETTEDIPDGATVAVMADPSNQAQSLWFLAQAGLITLRPDVPVAAFTQDDIIDNPRHLNITAESGALSGPDAVVGYAEQFEAEGLDDENLIFHPRAPQDFAAVLTVGSAFAGTEEIQRLARAFKDPRVQRYLATTPGLHNVLQPA